nr:transposase (putative), gypsy type [Tanacetum cinerariifolium]
VEAVMVCLARKWLGLLVEEEGKSGSVASRHKMVTCCSDNDRSFTLVWAVRWERRDRDTPYCYTKNIDSLNKWNDHFFWVNDFMVPLSVPWFEGVFVEKDPPPSDDIVNLELIEVLNENRSGFRKYPKVFLCVVGLSQAYDDDEDIRPTFLDSENEGCSVLSRLLIRLRFGSNFVAMDDFVSKFVTPSPTPKYEDESDSVQQGTIDSALAKDVYVPKWDITNYFKLEDVVVCLQDAHAKCIKKHATELDERITALDVDIDMDLCPHTLTAMAGRRWVIGHDFHLIVMKFRESYECRSRRGNAISSKIEKGIQEGLEAEIEHGKAGKDLKDVESYDVEAEAKYLAVVTKLENVPFPLLKDLLITEQLTVPVYYERGGSHVSDSWDRKILLNNALVASRSRGEKKKKNDASLDLVVSEHSTFAAGSQLSYLALLAQTFTIDALIVKNATYLSSATLKVATTALIPAVDPTVTSSASIIGVSQEPPIAITNYHIFDLTMGETEAQHDV